MWISRVRVTGGFLNGIDIQMVRGLNVIVGPRGVGKTTLLELIRHALGVQHADRGQQFRRGQSIEHLLGSGEVILELQSEFQGLRIIVDAEGRGRQPEFKEVALMLGQNELEAIASTPANRLNLIDLRAGVDAQSPTNKEIVSLTQAMAELKIQLRLAEDQSLSRGQLAADYEAVQRQEREMFSKSSVELEARRQVLQSMESRILRTEAQLDDSRQYSDQLRGVRAAHEQYYTALSRVRRRKPTALLAPSVEAEIDALYAVAERSRRSIQETLTGLDNLGSNLSRSRDELRTDAEPLRTELERSQIGLGQITATARNLAAQLDELDRLADTADNLRAEYKELRKQRDEFLLVVEQWQEEVFRSRRSVASSVTEQLNENVIVSVEHLADYRAFEEALIELLQGSNLQYRPLSRTLARALLPTQLLRFVEEEDYSGLADAADVSLDRAVRLVGHLQTPKALGVLAAQVLNDFVDFRLRDGVVEKSVEQLSTGQKCAVTLPIVLTELSRVLILDQPEDHIDNAYLVENVIRGLLRRTKHQAQTIVATHNANVPVIGSAEAVICLKSDGAHGYVEAAGPFSDSAIVDEITRVMEGGKDAFRRRANFYTQSGLFNE